MNTNKTTMKNIVNDIDLTQADMKFAWRIAHDPFIRSILIDRPYESLLGVDAVGSKKESTSAEVWKASMLVAIMYVGREDETGEMLPPPDDSLTVGEFVKSCQKEHTRQV